MPRPSPPFIADAAAADKHHAAGIWSLVGGPLHEIERFDIGPAILLVPTEQVLLLTADLPLQGLRRRAEALPFAIEDRIAQPLGAAHIALGAELSPQRHLVGVVSHDVMRGWLSEIAAAGIGHARIVPDALALPVPAAGFWSVDLAGARALIRRDDGTGLALPASHIVTAWTAAGRPRCISCGDSLPAEMAGEQRAPEPARWTDTALDLRQGAYAVPRTSIGRKGDGPPPSSGRISAALAATSSPIVAEGATCAIKARVSAARRAAIRPSASVSTPAIAPCAINPNAATKATRLASREMPVRGTA